MKFSYDLYGGPAQLKLMQVAGSSVKKGALMIRGVTSGTDAGMAKVAPTANALTDAIGVLESPITSADTPSVQATGVILLKKIIVNPWAVYRVEYSQAAADTFTGTMTSAGTAITCAALQDLTGGFVYDITSGVLQAIVGGAGLTTLTAFNPAVLATDYVLKILPNLSKLCDIDGTGTMFGGTGGAQAAAGTGVVSILDTYIQADTIPLQKLRADLHSGLNLLGKNPKFFADVVFPKHFLAHQS